MTFLGACVRCWSPHKLRQQSHRPALSTSSIDTVQFAGVDWTLDSKLHFWDLFTLPDDSRLVWEEHARLRATGNLELRLQCALGKSHSDCLLRIR